MQETFLAVVTGIDRCEGRARVTFTDPHAAAVGLTEAAARQAGLDVRVVRFATGDVAGAAVLGTEFPGSSQLVVDERRARTIVAVRRPRTLHATAGRCPNR